MYVTNTVELGRDEGAVRVGEEGGGSTGGSAGGGSGRGSAEGGGVEGGASVWGSSGGDEDGEGGVGVEAEAIQQPPHWQPAARKSAQERDSGARRWSQQRCPRRSISHLR